MKRRFLGPIVRLVQSIFDDSVADDEYHNFLQRCITLLMRALQEKTEAPSWSGEFRLALENLEAAGYPVTEPEKFAAEAYLVLPAGYQAQAWLSERKNIGIIVSGKIERFMALNLLAHLDHTTESSAQDLNNSLESLLRHIEIHRKASVNLREAGSPLERWYEVNDTAILFARAACLQNDLRYLNAAMKLTDWALPVHRRSVPVELLARYVLAVSEVRRAYKVLL